MIEISLTDFLDFVTASGNTKLTKVKECRYRPEYHPKNDYWRQLRQGIVEFHANGAKDKGVLADILNKVIDPKKYHRYDAAIRGYQKFLGKKEFEHFVPPKGKWTPDGTIAVIVNPELGLAFNRERHLVKLYFKQGKLTKRRVEMILLLMQQVFDHDGDRGYHFSVLDVEPGKLISDVAPNPPLLPLLIGEAMNFKTIIGQI